MPLYLVGGKLLVAENKLATNEDCCTCPPSVACVRPTQWRIQENDGDIYAKGPVVAGILEGCPTTWTAYWYSKTSLYMKLEVEFADVGWKLLEEWQSDVALCQNESWFATHALIDTVEELPGVNWQQPDPHDCAIIRNLNQPPEGERPAGWENFHIFQWWASDAAKDAYEEAVAAGEENPECAGCYQGYPNLSLPNAELGVTTYGPFETKAACDEFMCGIEAEIACEIKCYLTAGPPYEIKTERSSREWVFDAAIDGEWNNIKNWGHQNIDEWPDILPNLPFEGGSIGVGGAGASYQINAAVTTLSGILPPSDGDADEWVFPAQSSVIVNAGGSIGIKIKQLGNGAMGEFSIYGVVAGSGGCPINCEEGFCVIGQVAIGGATGGCDFLMFKDSARLDGIAISDGGTVQFMDNATTGAGAKLIGGYFLFRGDTTLEENCDTSAAANIYFGDTAKNKATIATIEDSPNPIVQFWQNSRNDSAGTVPSGTCFYGGTPNSSTVPGQFLCFQEPKGFVSVAITGSGGNYGTVDGDGFFYGNSNNFGTVDGEGSFNSFPDHEDTPHGATNKAAGVVELDGFFYDESVNEGLVKGDGKFYSASENNGTVNGDGTFLTEAVNKAPNGLVKGNGQFGDERVGVGAGPPGGSGYNEDTVDGDADFYHSSVNRDTGRVKGNAFFTLSSENSGTVDGNAQFTVGSIQAAGTVKGNAAFNGLEKNGEVASYPLGGIMTGGTVEGNAEFISTGAVVGPPYLTNGTIKGNATFKSPPIPAGYSPWEYTSHIAATETGAIVIEGDLTFEDSTQNSGTNVIVHGTVTFKESSANFGIIYANTVVFEDTAINAGQILPRTGGTATVTFKNNSSNRSSITGNVTFLDSATNYVGGAAPGGPGEIIGSATFKDDSRNMGIMNPSVGFSAAYNFAKVFGAASFENAAFNEGIVYQAATFKTGSENRGLVSPINPLDNATGNIVFDGGINTAAGVVLSFPLSAPLPLFKNSASNDGTIDGAVTFTTNATNNVTITGPAEFKTGATNAGTVMLASSFDSATNSGTVADTATFTNSATNSGTIIEGLFTGSTNSGTVGSGGLGGNATFEAGSTNSSTGVVGGNGIFTASTNAGTVSGSGTFAASSLNSGTIATGSFDTSTNSGTVSGDATFVASSLNSGTVDGDATFAASTNSGTVSGAGTFNTTSINSGTVTADATFNGTASNTGTVSGNAVFNSSSENSAGGTVSGDAAFYDASDNFGTVLGTLTCGTTGTC